MTEKEIIDGLVSRDEKVTREFFFTSCRPLFISIMNSVFSYRVDYDEMVNELYLYLVENDAYRLRQFQGRSTIYQWLKVVAIRYFIVKRDSVIDNESDAALLDSVVQKVMVDDEKNITARMDIEYLFSLMQNRRYVYVLRRLVLQECEPKVVAEELKINVDNLYNIKKRAIAALTEIALKEWEKYEREISK